MNVTLLRFTQDPLFAIEEAASVCYDSDPYEAAGKIAKHCYLSGHHSVLEHAYFTFKIEDASRACLAQLTRHRIASFSVQSQRYVDQTRSLVVVPKTISGNEEALKVFCGTVFASKSAYADLVEMGIPNEDARFVLPEGTVTTVIVTMNLREFINFCNLRLCARAQWEIRDLARKMVGATNEATNNVFDYMLVPACEKKPGYPVCPENKKQACGKYPRLEELYQWERIMYPHGRHKVKEGRK